MWGSLGKFWVKWLWKWVKWVEMGEMGGNGWKWVKLLVEIGKWAYKRREEEAHGGDSQDW
jgi:hypothetical protein